MHEKKSNNDGELSSTSSVSALSPSRVDRLPDSKTGSGETRKVQLTGGSTLVVSLPRAWVRTIGLKAKDEVHLSPQADLSLIITRVSPASGPSQSVTDVGPSSDEGELLRAFIAHYMAGFDIVRILFRTDASQLRSRFKARVREKLMGVEIIEESADAILAQCLHGNIELPVKRALDRMSTIGGAMQSDAVRSLLTGDVSLAKDVVERDNEVDRFSHFIARQLNLAILDRSVVQEIGLSSGQDCLNYRLVVKSVERIADHSVQIASSALLLDRKKIPQAFSEGLLKLSKQSGEVYEGALRSVGSMSEKTANETIQRRHLVLKEESSAAEELISSSRLDNQTVVSLRLALESLRRIAEYSFDICEIVFNLSVSRPAG